MNEKQKHGQPGKDEWAGGRWCEDHSKYHGIGYECEKYDDETIKDIQAKMKKFKDTLFEDNTLKGHIMKLFIGLDHEPKKDL